MNQDNEVNEEKKIYICSPYVQCQYIIDDWDLKVEVLETNISVCLLLEKYNCYNEMNKINY